MAWQRSSVRARLAPSPKLGELRAVHLAPVRDSTNDPEAFVVIDGVDDPMVADPNPIVVAPASLTAP